MATYAVTYTIKGKKQKRDFVIEVQADSKDEAFEEAKNWVGDDCVPRKAVRI
jgi:hypothetical protein